MFGTSLSALSDLQSLCLVAGLHNWDVNCSFSELPQFSVPLALLAPASRLRFPPLGQGMEHVALPLLSARFEFVGTWRLRCTATGTSTDLSLYCTWVTSIVGTRWYLPLHVHGDVDNFVDELHFDNLHVFFDGSDRWNLPLYHHCRLICP